MDLSNAEQSNSSKIKLSSTNIKKIYDLTPILVTFFKLVEDTLPLEFHLPKTGEGAEPRRFGSGVDPWEFFRDARDDFLGLSSLPVPSSTALADMLIKSHVIIEPSGVPAHTYKECQMSMFSEDWMITLF